jgi:hypothetical protein
MALIDETTRTKLGERLAGLDVNCAASFVGPLPETMFVESVLQLAGRRGRDA